MSDLNSSMRDKCRALYGEARGDDCYARLMALLDAFRAENPPAEPVDPARRLSSAT